MNTTDESLAELIKKGIIDSCDKHEEVIYFGALENCPVCNQVKSLKIKKKAPLPIIEETKEPELTDEQKAEIETKKKRRRYLIIGIILLAVLWVLSNMNAIMSWFK